MGFLRGLGTAICSLLLFLALGIFSMAFLLNSTVLNAGFVNSQVDKLDMSSIAQNIINDQIKDQVPADETFISDVSAKIVDTEEPLIKEQLHTGINSAYAYLLKENNDLNIEISFTEIKQSLKATLWQTSVDYLKEQLTPLSGDAANQYVDNIRQQIPEDALPQALSVLPQTLRKEVIDQYLLQLGGKGSTDVLSALVNFAVDPVVKQYFDQYFNNYIDQIPDSYSINSSTIDTNTMDNIQNIRTGIGYFKVYYLWLIVFMIVMAGLIFLINWRNIRASLRSLGIDLLIFGVLDLAGVLILRTMHISQFITNTNVPASVISWADGLLKNVGSIMMPFSIGVLVVAVILMVLSFMVKNPGETIA